MDNRIIYFAGNRLDYYRGGLVNGVPVDRDPVVIRGYDTAGNLLTAIRFGEGQGSPDSILGDAVGHLYVGVKNHPTEYFRKYRRNGDRIPFPNLHGARIRAIALDASGNIYVGGDEAGPEKYILRKYTAEGALVWSATASAVEFIDYTEYFPTTTVYPDRVYAMALASNGDVVTVGGKIDGGGLVRRYNGATGALLWTARPGGIPDSLAIAADGTIYTAGEGSRGYWLATDYFMPYGVLFARGTYAYSPADFVFIDPAPYNKRYYSLFKWSSAGEFVAAVDPWGDINYNLNSTSLNLVGSTLHVISDDISTTAYYSEATFANYKTYDLSLTELTAAVLSLNNRYEIDPETTYQVKVNDKLVLAANGVRYFPGNRVTATAGYAVSIPGGYGTMTITAAALYHFRVLDSDGVTPLWLNKNASGVVGVDRYGNTWEEQTYPGTATSYPPGYYTAWDQAFTELYATLAGGPDLGTTGTSYANDVDFWDCHLVHITELSQHPALALPLGLGLPEVIGDRYAIAPPLALSIAVRLPTTIRDFLGTIPAQTIYRLFLTGTPDLELPMASLSCRRTTGGIHLAVVCPAATPDRMAAIAARSTGALVVRRGVRFADRTEQLEDFLTVPLQTIAVDTGSQSASFTLSGIAAT